MADWNERVRLVYAREVMVPQLNAFWNLLSALSVSKPCPILKSIDDCLEAIGEVPETEAPKPFGDIYFLNGKYHVGEPQTSLKSVISYRSKGLSGELETGYGRILAYMLMNIGRTIPDKEICHVSGWAQATSIKNLMKQMSSSEYFKMERKEEGYVLNIKQGKSIE